MLTMRCRIIKWPAVNFIEISLWSGSCHLQYIPVGSFFCDCHRNGDNINWSPKPPRSRLYPDQMITTVTWIQSVSSPDGGSAPRDDLYSPEHQRRPGQLDEPQRQIPSEDLVS